MFFSTLDPGNLDVSDALGLSVKREENTKQPGLDGMQLIEPNWFFDTLAEFYPTTKFYQWAIV